MLMINGSNKGIQYGNATVPHIQELRALLAQPGLACGRLTFDFYSRTPNMEDQPTNDSCSESRFYRATAWTNDSISRMGVAGRLSLRKKLMFSRGAMYSVSA